MRPVEITRALTALIPTRRPVYLWGPPGVGKSSLVKQVAEQLDLDLLDLRAVLLDPVDLRGLPTVTKNQAVWCPPSFFPKAGKGIIFLDELAQGPPLVQAGCLQLTLDGRVGDYILPPGWTVLAASNRQEDRAGAHKLITPLLNRFIHLDLDVSAEDWLAWAVEANIHPYVRGFVNFKQDMLHKFNPASSDRAFPTPRSWQFVSDVLDTLPQELRRPVVAGIVGDGPAAEFHAYCLICEQIPDPEELLKNPLTATVPSANSLSVLHAIINALVDRIRGADAKRADSFMKYVNRLPTEFSVYAVKMGLLSTKALFASPTFTQWHTKNKHLILDVQSA